MLLHLCHTSDTQVFEAIIEAAKHTSCGVGNDLQPSIYSTRLPEKPRTSDHIVSSMMADTMSPSAALSARIALGLLTPACRATDIHLVNA